MRVTALPISNGTSVVAAESLDAGVDHRRMTSPTRGHLLFRGDRGEACFCGFKL